MDLSQIPLFRAVKEKMNWLSARQNVLAQNIANADTPHYVPHDVRELDFASMVREPGRLALAKPMSSRMTNAEHVPFAETAGVVDFKLEKAPGSEVNPSGNAVVLEEEMMKIADTSSQYQAATAIYAKGLGLIRIALGRP
ncbi:MAG: flagellar basal body rod protein FlgB [Alphaproteobacteria bacterium]|nr:flagellar basal body rod protein FlgB [Alphaproteobacteria bacterium]